MLAPAVVMLSVAAAAAPVKLAVLDFQAADLAKDKAAFFTESFATRLNEFGARATTARSTGALLSLDRQKQMLGCSETSCLAEIAAALGVDGIVTGDVAKVGSSFQLSVRVLSAKDSTLLAAQSERAGSEEGLVDLVAPLARDIVVAASKALGRDVPELALKAPERPRPLRAAAIVTGIAGLAVAGAGAGLFAASRGLYAQIPQTADAPARSADDVTVLVRDGKALQSSGVAALAVGGAAVAAAVTLFIVDAASGPTPTVALGPQGEAWFGVTGTF